MKDVFKLPVFPAADVFPMMTDDELQELAEDIKANGLHEPLVKAEIDTPETPEQPKTMMLIDGRNRREACKIAGVVPETRVLNGPDPKAFIISRNVHRRNMTRGQQAMAVAMIYPEPEVDHSERGKKGGPGKKRRPESDSFIHIHRGRLSEARTVLQYEPALAETVLNGSEALDAAYRTAKSRKLALNYDLADAL